MTTLTLFFVVRMSAKKEQKKDKTLVEADGNVTRQLKWPFWPDDGTTEKL